MLFIGDIQKGYDKEDDRRRKIRSENARLYSNFVASNPNASVEEREKFAGNLGKSAWERSLLPSRETMERNVATAEEQARYRREAQQFQRLQQENQAIDILAERTADALGGYDSFDAARDAMLESVDENSRELTSNLLSRPEMRDRVVRRATTEAVTQYQPRINSAILAGQTPEQFASTLETKNPIIREALDANYRARFTERMRILESEAANNLSAAASQASTQEDFNARVDLEKQRLIRQGLPKIPEQVLTSANEVFAKRMAAEADQQRGEQANAYQRSLGEMMPKAGQFNSFEEFKAEFERTMTRYNETLNPDLTEQLQVEWDNYSSRAYVDQVIKTNQATDAAIAQQEAQERTLTAETQENIITAIEPVISNIAGTNYDLANDSDKRVVQVAATTVSTKVIEISRDFDLPVNSVSHQLAIAKAAQATTGSDIEDIGDALSKDGFLTNVAKEVAAADPAFAAALQQTMASVGVSEPSLVMKDPALKQALVTNYKRQRLQIERSRRGYIPENDITRSKGERIAGYSDVASQLKNETSATLQEIESFRPVGPEAATEFIKNTRHKLLAQQRANNETLAEMQTFFRSTDDANRFSAEEILQSRKLAEELQASNAVIQKALQDLEVNVSSSLAKRETGEVAVQSGALALDGRSISALTNTRQRQSVDLNQSQINYLKSKVDELNSLPREAVGRGALQRRTGDREARINEIFGEIAQAFGLTGLSTYQAEAAVRRLLSEI